MTMPFRCYEKHIPASLGFCHLLRKPPILKLESISAKIIEQLNIQKRFFYKTYKTVKHNGSEDTHKYCREHLMQTVTITLQEIRTDYYSTVATFHLHFQVKVLFPKCRML
ncbi:hypothetical protein O6H91_04G041400 [Diphasiastrum complanatum]|uniref:Uncharacterized protein n=1 Tax=Diphasiastrum complanatum TaxID=34168 RepID=A0ACC2DW29_DIPCM|nr:hypothetical protein O6H91_04G041400 [Diphasiastrum complanatum]